MTKYTILAVIVLLSVAYVMSAPAASEEAEIAPGPAEVETVEEGATKKTKRGIYGGSYGYGIGYPFGYSHYPYGDDLKIAVVGAGVIGVTTALELKKQFRNAKIEVIADKFYEDTTSYVAAGLFRPGTSFSGPNQEITEKWMQTSYNYWDELRKSRDGPTTGVIELSGYIFSSQFPDIVKNRFLEKVCPLYRPCSEDELMLCPGNWKFGSFFTTILTESSWYIPWAVRQFQTLGGNLVPKRVDSLSLLGLEYDVVVNCSGLGAKFLCQDHQMVPIRGQVIKVKAPWLRTFFYGDLDTYIIPGMDSVTLGGCRQYESWDVQINKFDSMRIKEQCEGLLPGLKNCEVLGHKVGLRPHRGIVRVEKELIQINGKTVKLVHNYGHGGYGVTTAPGTSLHACQLVQEILSGNSKL